MVAEVFAPLMARDFWMLLGDRSTRSSPSPEPDLMSTSWPVGTSTRSMELSSVRLSRRPACRGASTDQCRHYGNTSPASLDEDRRADLVTEGDLVILLWVGAGNSALNGYAVVVL